MKFAGTINFNNPYMNAPQPQPEAPSASPETDIEPVMELISMLARMLGITEDELQQALIEQMDAEDQDAQMQQPQTMMPPQMLQQFPQ